MKIVHVAVGVIKRQGKILLAKRADHQHQGGLWEFPGGKVEPNESVQSALARELQEELAITPTASRPFIQIRHDYGDKCVLLDVWLVTDFTGEPAGCEGQPLVWAPVAELKQYDFPAANVAIVTALSLPEQIAITPSAVNLLAVKNFAKQALQQATAIQIRSPQLSCAEVWELFDDILSGSILGAGELTAEQIIVNSRWLPSSEAIQQAQARGVMAVHVKGSDHHRLGEFVAAFDTVYCACHSPQELHTAEQAGATAALLSPVQNTNSHPEAKPLGWPTFADWVAATRIPVYALGGMTPQDLATAQQYYGQGIAAINGYALDG